MYSLPTRREQASWKSWGGIQTEAAVTEEVQRIGKELAALGRQAEFPHEFLPVVRVASADAAQALKQATTMRRSSMPVPAAGDA